MWLLIRGRSKKRRVSALSRLIHKRVEFLITRDFISIIRVVEELHDSMVGKVNENHDSGYKRRTTSSFRK